MQAALQALRQEACAAQEEAAGLRSSLLEASEEAAALRLDKGRADSRLQEHAQVLQQPPRLLLLQGARM